MTSHISYRLIRCDFLTRKEQVLALVKEDFLRYGTLSVAEIHENTWIIGSVNLDLIHTVEMMMMMIKWKITPSFTT